MSRKPVRRKGGRSALAIQAGGRYAGGIRSVSHEETIRAMNRFEPQLGFKGEAKLRYLDGEVQLLAPGDFVRCAVTGKVIPLEELRYWSIELQEPYADAATSLKRYCEVHGCANAPEAEAKAEIGEADEPDPEKGIS